MKILRDGLGIVCAFCLMIVFLITSVEAVAYWTPGYYENEYEKYDVLSNLPEMSMENLLYVTDEMMDYLRGDRDDLHVFTTIGGEEREFFNEREIAHMEDVQNLFLGGMALRTVCLLTAAACLIALFFLEKKNMLRTVPRALCIGTGVFFAVCLLIAGIIATDFSRYFVVFHEIFFNNDLWLLDPRTDLLINIVPEPFFMDTALRIGLTFAAAVLVFFFINLGLWMKFGRRMGE